MSATIGAEMLIGVDSEVHRFLPPALERICSIVLKANVARDAIEQPLPARLQ
jgi:hypothetical protein